MNFRLSRITEHNKNEETDHLYDPLRDTLRKSSVSKGKTLERVTSAHQLRGSRVSTMMRELTPEEAEQMQRQIWIPADKKLKPTDHLTRVAGKDFYAVDVQERTMPTISQEQFKVMYHGDKVQQTVYEFGSSNDPSKQQSPFTQDFRANRLLAGNYNQQTRQNNDTYVGYRQTEIFKSNTNNYGQSSQYGRIENQRESGVGRFSRAGRLESNKESYLNRQKREQGSERNEYDRNIEKESGKGNVVEDPSKNTQSRRNSKYGRAKSTYKYNLFSSLDEAVNTKCGSFGKNEIIASKPVRPWG